MAIFIKPYGEHFADTPEDREWLDRQDAIREADRTGIPVIKPGFIYNPKKAEVVRKGNSKKPK